MPLHSNEVVQSGYSDRQSPEVDDQRTLTQLLVASGARNLAEEVEAAGVRLEGEVRAAGERVGVIHIGVDR